MIKLNNKNITYVALADSSNSLKAPKEIWYADSNNSVKLVYRRKDALIEGEDYEKYHWLVANGDDLQSSSSQNVALFSFPSDVNLVGKTVQLTIGAPCRDIYVYRYVGAGLYLVLYVWNGNVGINVNNQAILFSPLVSQEPMVLDFENNLVSYNGQQAQIAGDSFYIYFPSNAIEGKRKYGRIYCQGLFDFIPCKLLKPVPKWLDANGIRRQVGECGMIDLVSGKFYGNVNSVGTFTVENYYERKEWLVGDGSAYIVNQYNLWNNKVETKSARIDLQKTENNDLVYTDATGLNWAIQQNPTLVPQLMVNFREEGAGVHILEVNPTPETFELEFYKKNGYAVCLFDGIEHQGRTITESKWNKDISPRIYSYKMAYIREVLPDGSYRSNLIPCTLTMDLPASMDANNIARTKGTSGMWDLISDRFYGNVANSGTFKAVNLAEGVDYEVHDWLVADIPIGIAMMSLPINSSTFNCTIEHTGARANLQHLYSNGYIYYTESSNMDIISVWDVNGVNTLFSTSVGSLMTIESNEEYFKVNNISITKYGFPILRMVIQSAHNSNNASTTKTSKISVDGIESYIPVKLLRSIPSKYDANGIARQAGECGMYDTVNDKFYGNVASSGTFTVSDDE